TPRLRKELFTFNVNKIAVQVLNTSFALLVDAKGQWFRTYGLEDCTSDESGLMHKQMMSGNDVAISEAERWFKPGVDTESVVITEKHLWLWQPTVHYPQNIITPYQKKSDGVA
ncbi:hypothetical protein MPER_12576, partial [Moniliophthora perniciosa FA553]